MFVRFYRLITGWFDPSASWTAPWVPIFWLLLMAYFLVWYFKQEDTLAYKALYPNETQDADYLIQDVVWEHYAADARLTYRLKADLMLHYRDRRLSLLEQPDMQWFMPYQDWLAESREGTFFHDRQVLNLHQKVQMRRQSDSLSDDYFSDPRSLVFKTDNLDLFLQEDRGYTEAEVKVFTDWWPKSVSHKNKIFGVLASTKKHNRTQICTDEHR